MELKSIGKFAKRIGVITIGIGIKEKKKRGQKFIQKRTNKKFLKLLFCRKI